MLYNFSRFGRKKGVVIPMVLASIGAAGSAFISTYGDPDNGEYKTEGIPIFLCVHHLHRMITLLVTFTIVCYFRYGIFRGVDFLAIPLQ